jgi:hypothetical protein
MFQLLPLKCSINVFETQHPPPVLALIAPTAQQSLVVTQVTAFKPLPRLPAGFGTMTQPLPEFRSIRLLLPDASIPTAQQSLTPTQVTSNRWPALGFGLGTIVQEKVAAATLAGDQAIPAAMQAATKALRPRQVEISRVIR